VLSGSQWWPAVVAEVAVLSAVWVVGIGQRWSLGSAVELVILAVLAGHFRRLGVTGVALVRPPAMTIVTGRLSALALGTAGSGLRWSSSPVALVIDWVSTGFVRSPALYPPVPSPCRSLLVTSACASAGPHLSRPGGPSIVFALESPAAGILRSGLFVGLKGPQ